MRSQINELNGVLTATLSDSLTFADHGLFRKLLEDVQASTCLQCVFNLSELKLIDSSGLGMMMIAIEESKKNGWKLSVADANGPVLQLLQLSRLDKLLMQ
ncbi:hypothetical protein MMA231_03970 (plasmid) [Asticcacaulis sp. MM231]|uniref:STAS domain-containing protein n=1 Tax=Asticcacaulis sp. MM231 TaxID=3157666 RepID=UPI0032D59A98